MHIFGKASLHVLAELHFVVIGSQEQAGHARRHLKSIPLPSSHVFHSSHLPDLGIHKPSFPAKHNSANYDEHVVVREEGTIHVLFSLENPQP